MHTLIYSDIQEDTSRRICFDNSTVQYVLKHQKSTHAMIVKIGKFNKDRDVNHIDEIYSDLIIQLAKASDYDINKAMKEETGTIVSFESYIASYVKHCCQRYNRSRAIDGHGKLSLDSDIKQHENCRNSSSNGKTTVAEVTADESRTEIENLCYRVEDSLYELRYVRAVYDVDIYLMIYLRLRLKEDADYNLALEACGYNRKEIQRAQSKLACSDELRGLVRAITTVESEIDPADHIAKYIYCLGAVDTLIGSIEKSPVTK